MPLHLLTKKSWNVYAPANIERVKRDEAEARRQTIEQEKRSLRDEADNRLESLKQQQQQQGSAGERKSLKRKLPGEDDTDRDIRLALARSSAPTTSTSRRNEETNDLDSSIHDATGHISLIPDPPPKKPRVDKVAEKDPYTVYLTDATGRDQNSKETWYTSLNNDQSSSRHRRDADPRRQERELARANANDPLAAMKKGVKALRETEKARTEWMAQRERDLDEVERLARKRSKEKEKEKDKRRRNVGSRHGEHGHERERDGDDLDSLEDFDLDAGYKYSNTKSEVQGTGHDRAAEDRGRDGRDADGTRDRSRHHRHRHRHHHHHHHHGHRSRKERHSHDHDDAAATATAETKSGRHGHGHR